MPKVRLTYSFTLPEEQIAYEQMSRVEAYASVLHDYYQWVRSQSKHGGGDDVKTGPAAFHECYDEFMRLCRDAGFNPLTGCPG